MPSTAFRWKAGKKTLSHPAAVRHPSTQNSSSPELTGCAKLNIKFRSWFLLICTPLHKRIPFALYSLNSSISQAFPLGHGILLVPHLHQPALLAAPVVPLAHKDLIIYLGPWAIAAFIELLVGYSAAGLIRRDF